MIPDEEDAAINNTEVVATETLHDWSKEHNDKENNNIELIPVKIKLG